MVKICCGMKSRCQEVPETFGFVQKELFVTENGPDDDSNENPIFIETGGKYFPPCSAGTLPRALKTSLS